MGDSQCQNVKVWQKKLIDFWEKRPDFHFIYCCNSVWTGYFSILCVKKHGGSTEESCFIVNFGWLTNLLKSHGSNNEIKTVSEFMEVWNIIRSRHYFDWDSNLYTSHCWSKPRSFFWLAYYTSWNQLINAVFVHSWTTKDKGIKNLGQNMPKQYS